MLILIFDSKSGFRDVFGQYDTKTIILRRFLAKRLLATPKVPGYQKVFETASCTLILKLKKFQLRTPNRF